MNLIPITLAIAICILAAAMFILSIIEGNRQLERNNIPLYMKQDNLETTTHIQAMEYIRPVNTELLSPPRQ